MALSHRSHRRLAPLVVTAGIAVASILTSAPAQAETQSHDDKTGDVSLIRARAAHATLDIASYTNDYTNGALTMSTSMVNLAESGWQLVWLAKAEDKFFIGYAFNDGDGLEYGLRNAKGKKICKGPDGTQAAVSENTVTLAVPSSCVKDADSVRIANYTYVPKGKRKALVDDANQGKLTNKSRPKFAAKLAYTAPL